MRATIISIGDELIHGQCVDTNSAWLSERLGALGVGVVRHVTVGDSVADIRACLTESLLLAELVIVTGGLGPTLDDVTREALAEAIHQPLQIDDEALRHIRAFFSSRERAMPESNRRQALIPKTCVVIPNRLGTAPGIRFDGPNVTLFALPGVPGEMKAMVEEFVVPKVRSRTGDSCMKSRVLLTYGMSESAIGEQLAEFMRRGRSPSVGTTASRAIISIRIVARGTNAAVAEELVQTDADAIRRILGLVVFGENDATLQSAVGELLLQHGKTVSTAESCTGGLLAKCLTDVPGSSGYFREGYVVYSNEAKCKLLKVAETLIEKHGAVSEAVAGEMAIGCLNNTGCDFALAITGIAGPGGAHPPEKPIGLVYVALACRSDSGSFETDVKRVLLGDTLSREEVRDRATKAALKMLRLKLLMC